MLALSSREQGELGLTDKLPGRNRSSHRPDASQIAPDEYAAISLINKHV